MSAQQVAKRSSSSKSKGLPVFKVAADKGTHPPVQLDRTVCVVGRRGSAHLPLNAPQVSKVHALIVREEGSGHVYVRDLASTNGVEVNGAKVNEATLGDQDVVRIGAYTLRCESGFGERNGTAEDTNAPAARVSVNGQSMQFPRGKHTLLIGQRGTCDVRLEDPSVAPVHAILFELDGRHYVRAFEAPGGTKLNGQPVEQQAELSPGDEIGVGKFSIHYERIESPATESESSRITPVAEHHAEDDALSGDELVDLAMSGEIEPDASHSSADVIELGESGISTAVRDTPKRIPPPSQPPPLPVDATSSSAADALDEIEVDLEPVEVQDEVEVELEPAPIEDHASEPVEVDHGLDIEPLDEAPPALTPPVAAVAPTRAPTPAKARVTPADDFPVVVDDDDDLTDITPFDLGSADAAATGPEAPYVDEAMEATFGSALKFDASTVGNDEDALASLIMPTEDETDLGATFDEAAAVSAVSPVVEAPYEKPAAPVATPSASKDVPRESLAAVEDEHDDDDDIDLMMELARPSGREVDEMAATVDEMAATVDESEPQTGDAAADSPLAVVEADAAAEVVDDVDDALAVAGDDDRKPEAEAAVELVDDDSDAELTVADDDSGEVLAEAAVEPPAAEIEPSPAAVSNGGQAAGLEALAEQAGLKPAAAPAAELSDAGSSDAPTPSLEEIGAMLHDVVAKVDALKAAWAAYHKPKTRGDSVHDLDGHE